MAIDKEKIQASYDSLVARASKELANAPSVFIDLKPEISRWNSHQDNGVELIYRGLALLAGHNFKVVKAGGPPPPVDPEFLLDVFRHEFKSRLETSRMRDNFATYVNTLIIFGCPKNQAVNAMAEWLGYKRTSVRTAQEKHQIKDDDDSIQFLEIFGRRIAEFISKADSQPFPINKRKHPLAYKAFQCLEKLYADPQFLDLLLQSSQRGDEGFIYFEEIYPRLYLKITEVCPCFATHGTFVFKAALEKSGFKQF